jgi:hypothetical protein
MVRPLSYLKLTDYGPFSPEYRLTVRLITQSQSLTVLEVQKRRLTD